MTSKGSCACARGARGAAATAHGPLRSRSIPFATKTKKKHKSDCCNFQSLRVCMYVCVCVRMLLVHAEMAGRLLMKFSEQIDNELE